MFARQLCVLAALIFVVSLTGSQCVFVAWSGGSSDDDDEDTGLVVFVREGRFVDAPVEGLRYESGVVSGVTDDSGRFRYQLGSSVRFSIGDIELGRSAAGRSLMTPLDLVPGGTLDTPAVINIARLVQSLDALPGDAVITLPASLHTQAVRSNAALAGAIDILDFADDTAFVNAASQLVAVLTADYPFTVVLVDAAAARAELAAAVDAPP